MFKYVSIVSLGMRERMLVLKRNQQCEGSYVKNRGEKLIENENEVFFEKDGLEVIQIV